MLLLQGVQQAPQVAMTLLPLWALHQLLIEAMLLLRTLLGQLLVQLLTSLGQGSQKQLFQTWPALAAVHASRTIELGPRPGKRNTCVRRPEPSSARPSTASGSSTPATHDDLEYADERDSPLHIPDSDDDELECAERAVFGRPVGHLAERLIDLDDSESDGETSKP